MPLARLVQQSQYRNDLPLEEKSDHATSPPPPSPPPHPGRHRVKGQKHAQKNRWKRPGQEAARWQTLHPEPNKGQDLVTPQIPVSRPDLTISSQAPTSPGTTPITWGAVSLWPTLGATAEADLSKTGATSLMEHPDIQQAHSKEAKQSSEVEQTGKPLLVTSKHRHTAGPSSPGEQPTQWQVCAGGGCLYSLWETTM